MAIANTFCHVYLRLGCTFSEYKEIAEWLGDYIYTIPANRFLCTSMSYSLLNHYHGDLTKAWHASHIVEHFNSIIQGKIIQWISQQERHE